LGVETEILIAGGRAMAETEVHVGEQYVARVDSAYFRPSSEVLLEDSRLKRLANSTLTQFTHLLSNSIVE
jgi:hypothetical protein